MATDSMGPVRAAQLAMLQAEYSLREAAKAYRRAWLEQRTAKDAMTRAQQAVEVAYGDAMPQQVQQAFDNYAVAAEEAMLLTIPVDDGALHEMSKGAEQLEAVGGAARALAEALEKEGGLQ